MPSSTNSSGSVYSASDWLNNHFSIKSRGRFSYLASLPIRAGDRILDLGCANGSWSKLMAERVGPSGRVVAVDHDPELIEQASRSIRETHLNGRLMFSVMDVSRDLIELKPEYSVITAFNFMSLLPDTALLLEAVHKLLLPRKGLLILKDSAISTDFYWPLSSELAYEIRRRLEDGGKVNSYDPNFALNCREIISNCGFFVSDTILDSYAFMYPFSAAERRYISTNAHMISEMDCAHSLSSELKEWTSKTLSEDGPFFKNPEAIYTTTEFTFVCSTN